MKELLNNVKREYLNKQTLIYMIFGQLTTAVSLVTFYFGKYLFAGFENIFKNFPGAFILAKPYLWANIFSWFCAVTFSFLTSKFFVFHSKSKDKAFFKEGLNFYSGRFISLIFQQFGLYLLVEKLYISPFISKILTGCIVVVLNFFFAKYIFYGANDETGDENNDIKQGVEE